MSFSLRTTQPNNAIERVSVKDLSVLDRTTKGSLLEFCRDDYEHWAVYIGQRQLVNLTHDGEIIVQPYTEVQRNSIVYVNNTNDNREGWVPFSPDEIVERALSKLNNMTTYNLTSNNCEHFANWCRYGKEKSFQVKEKGSKIKKATTKGLCVGAAVGGPVGAVVGAFGGFSSSVVTCFPNKISKLSRKVFQSDPN